MCGIAGFYNSDGRYSVNEKYWENILDKMNEVQKHRGPDDEGNLITPKCGLAHVRLSIIDIDNGHQPMVRTEGERKCAIVYNGEIYNMKELREHLSYVGTHFMTHSDTEVILAGYMRYGEKFIKRLNGIFAMAIWEYDNEILLLIRDRIGVKPLFYSDSGSDIVFSSEIKGIFEHPDITPEINLLSMQILWGLGPAKPQGSGVFKNIKELKPGHMLVIQNGEVKDKVYWKLISQPHEDSEEQTIAKTEWLIEDSVNKQMLSDIPISTFLSGGVDSSLVTAICGERLKRQGKTLNTFSFDFEGNDKYFKSNSFQPSQDRPWVDKMVEYTGTNHRYLECDSDNLESYLYKAVDARDLPCMADVESSMMYFCNKVTEYNKVTLTGECADEIFGGYPWFHRKEMFDAGTFPWAMDLSPRIDMLKPEVAEELDIENFVKGVYEDTVSQTPYLRGEKGIERRRREISYLNLKWFMTTLLDRMDRTSMHCGLEARVPFADHRIVEYVWNVPWDIKYRKCVVKGLLRAAGEKFLPYDVLYRKKSPYPKTYNPDYEKSLLEQVMTVTSDANATLNVFVDRKKIEEWNKTPSDYGKPWYGQLMAGPQMLAYILQMDYWLKKYNI